jgi:hypothetical protein
MGEESNKRNGADRGPSRTTWPPPWLAGVPRPAGRRAAGGSAEPASGPSTVPAHLREAWEERVCIMHYDGGRPRDEAERLALADVLDHAERNGP